MTEGQTIRTRCIVCNGQDTFTITHHGGVIVHNCYRASCDKTLSSGAVFLDLSVEDRRKAFLVKREKEGATRGQGNILDWTHPSYWIDGIGDEQCRQYMVDKHMMLAYKEGLFRPMYDPAERRFIFPIKDNNGLIVGAVGRTLVGAKPKTLNYNRSYNRPFVCGSFDKAVVVEDCASAVSVTRLGVTGVALLGTHLREDFIPHLSPYKAVGIALDPDAFGKSFKIKRTLDNYLKNVYIIRLPKDVKDMTDDELNREDW